MPSPTSRRGTRNAQFQRRIPADIAAKAAGIPVVLELPAAGNHPAVHVSAVHTRTHIKFSLGTSDKVLANQRQAIALAHMEAVWSSLRSGPVALDHFDTVALSKEVYVKFIADHHREPGSRERWAAVKGLNRAVREGRTLPVGAMPVLTSGNVASQAAAVAELVKDCPLSLTDAINAHPASSQGPSNELLEDRFGALADYVLARHGLIIDALSRLRLLVQVEAASTDAARTLKRNAEGDYRPDPVAERFPKVVAKAAKKASAGTEVGVTWEQFVGLWAKHHQMGGGSPDTRREFTAFFKRFAAFVKKAPGEVTHDDVAAWRTKRLNDGIAPITVAEKDLTQLRSLYRLAVEERMLSANPAREVRVRRMRKAARMRGFTDDQAAAILEAATREDKPYRRWVPWLLALTGSRAAAAMNLRACDVKSVDGHWCIEITDEASKATKTEASCRVVPLHPALIKQGFVEFSKGVGGDLPLFYRHRAKRRGTAIHNPGKAPEGHLRDWTYSLGIPEIGSKAHRRAPLHAWRHWFKAAARTAGLSDTVSDALSGHEGSSEGSRYGHGGIAIAALAEAVAKISVPTSAA